MKQQSVFKTQPLTAEQQITVNVTGSSFFIDSVDGVVYVKFDDGAELRMISGSYFDCDPGQYFQRITFRSPVTAGGATLTVKYYAGTLKVGNRTPVVYTRPAPTYVIAIAPVIGGGGTYTVPNTNLRTGQPVADAQVRVRIENVGLTNACEPRISGVTFASLSATGAGAINTIVDIETPAEITVFSTLGTTLGVLVYYALPT